MAGLHTNQLQAAILFEGADPLSMVLLAHRVADVFTKAGMPLHAAQASDDIALLTGTDDLWITLEFVPQQGDPAVFARALASRFNGLATPDAAERVGRHRSMVLIEVRHGVLPASQRLHSLLDEIGMERPGASLPLYQQRTDVLAHLCRMVTLIEGANLIHWTPSDLLVVPERFPAADVMECPNFLSVHPNLYGGREVPGFEEVTAGFYTIGAAHLIGREIHVVEAPVPWVEQFVAAHTFIRLAVMENGYIIPDDETWSVEGGEFTYRVRHFEANTPGCVYTGAHYRLTLERDDRHGWTAPDYVPTEPIEGGLPAQIAAMDPNDPQDRERMDRWIEREAMSARVGGQFSVSRRMDGGGYDGSPTGKSPPPSTVPPDPAAIDAYEADRPLDPNDPIDRAILERLRERERQGEPEPTPSAEARPAPVVNRARAAFGRRKGGFATRH